MSGDEFYEVGSVEGEDGTRLSVGVDGGRVAVYAGAWLSADGAIFGEHAAEEFAHLFVTACWQAAQDSGRVSGEAGAAGSSLPGTAPSPPYPAGHEGGEAA